MILARIGLRNLVTQKVKTLIIGSVLVLGMVLIIVGNGIIDAIDTAMEVSVINSVSGHIQLYSDKAKEDLQVFGDHFGAIPDYGTINDYSRIERAIRGVDNVATVVPMGIDLSFTTIKGPLERKLTELRAAVAAGDDRRIHSVTGQLRRIIGLMDKELESAELLLDVDSLKRESGDYTKVLARARSEAFWEELRRDPNTGLEFLEHKIGPLSMSMVMVSIVYIGTDTALFKKTFDRLEIVQGTMIPPGRRGFLFNQLAYDKKIKNKTAFRLDMIKGKLEEGQRIATCPDCQTWIRNNVNHAAVLTAQLDETAARRVGVALREHLGSKAQDLTKVMKSFLAMSDESFQRRYQLFYRVVAPHINLYSIKIGDELLLSGFTQGGYERKVPVKVYGTFRFRGLDRSPLAGVFSFMDIMTFRDLYGYMSKEKQQEHDAIRRSVKVEDIAGEEIEDALFGGNEDLVDSAGQSDSFDPLAGVDMRTTARYGAALQRRVYSQQEISSGVVPNAAVFLKDGQRLTQTLAAIRKVIVDEKLGLRAISWRQASGKVGKLIKVIQIVLFSAVLIIFVVALIIINNSLLMSTMERRREIGTMRAIGSSRGFIMQMFLFETGVLTLIFGGVGAALGAIVMRLLQVNGIPARSDFLHFLFGGSRLYPEMLARHVIIAGVAILVVAFFATLYPAWIATKITPREAMASEE